MRTFEQQKALVRRLNVIDDVFFHKIAENQEVCEEILRIILNDPELEILESQVQRFLRNVGAHSVILDLLCSDKRKSQFNVEVQGEEKDNYQKRMRFNGSNIDTIFTERGIPYGKIPDVYLIFISKFDIFGQGKTIYHIDRTIRENGKSVYNGVHEIYVNTKVDDHTVLAELMQYFRKSEGYHENFPKLCEQVNYYKEQKEGMQVMCDVMRELTEEAEKRGEKRGERRGERRGAHRASRRIAIGFLKNGIPVDVVARSIPELSYKEVEALQKKYLK